MFQRIRAFPGRCPRALRKSALIALIFSDNPRRTAVLSMEPNCFGREKGLFIRIRAFYSTCLALNFGVQHAGCTLFVFLLKTRTSVFCVSRQIVWCQSGCRLCTAIAKHLAASKAPAKKSAANGIVRNKAQDKHASHCVQLSLFFELFPLFF